MKECPCKFQFPIIQYECLLISSFQICNLLQWTSHHLSNLRFTKVSWIQTSTGYNVYLQNSLVPMCIRCSLDFTTLPKNICLF